MKKTARRAPLFFIEIFVHLMYNYSKVFLLRNGGSFKNDAGIKGYNS